jgi:hypothetical protein
VFSTDTRTFTFGARVPPTNIPAIGTLIRTEPFDSSTGRITVAGVVYQVRVEGDSSTRQLSVAGAELADAEIEWQRSRQIPIEVTALRLGYYTERPDDAEYGYTPLPPPTLGKVTPCDEEEVRALTRSPRFLRAMLDARDLVDLNTLIHATIARAARVHPRPDEFKKQCGRELARRFSNDAIRLEDLLIRILS